MQLDKPYGGVCSIVDAISLLELMGVSKGDFMTNMSIANEVGKTAYSSPEEATIIKSFLLEVPGVFLDGSGSRIKDSFDAKALQLLRKYSDWTEHDSSNGIYYRIHDYIESFEERETQRISSCGLQELRKVPVIACYQPMLETRDIFTSKIHRVGEHFSYYGHGDLSSSKSR